MTTHYYEVVIPFTEENYELIQNTLYSFEVESILEEKGVFKIYFDEDRVSIIDELKNVLEKDASAKGISFQKFENKNWNSEWEKSIEPVYIKDRIVIHSSWNKSEIENPEVKILIEIDPKMSFGTGHNETTQLVLEMMTEYLENGDNTMLDYGCGTAVLSIAAAKLGVEKIIGVDIDVDAVENSKEYIKLNNVSEFIKIDNCNISSVEENNFDVIAANIIRSVITANMNHIHSKLKPGGKLFLSGILAEEEELIIALLNKFDFEVIEVRKKAEWLGAYARRK